MFNLANWTAYVKERERIRGKSSREGPIYARTWASKKSPKRVRGIVVRGDDAAKFVSGPGLRGGRPVEPGRSSDGEEFGRPQDGAASLSAPPVGSRSEGAKLGRGTYMKSKCKIK